MKISLIKKNSLLVLFFAVIGFSSCKKSLVETTVGNQPVKTEGEPPVAHLDTRELLFTETFDSGTLASKPWIGLQSGNQNYSAIVNGVLRHNLRTALGGNDPITGKKRSGLQTHTFKASNFYSADTIGSITVEMKFRFDQSFWSTSAGDAYPIAAGKLFLSDTDFDSNGPYLGLTNYGTITLVAQNGTSDFNTWTSRTYGWKNASGTARNNIYLRTDTAVFKTDGEWRTLTFEIRYNPDSIGYHKGRLKSDGVVLVDNAGLNTDAQGWFNLPIEYVFKGFRMYASSVDITSGAQDYSTDPTTYAGYAGGFEVDSYTIYRGYKD
ncbi:MAG: hypothetical protein QM781_13280 [Chitinophagaceae bacterium]